MALLKQYLTKKMIAAIVLSPIVLFACIQLIPVDRSNPPVVSEPNWDSPQTRAYAEQACFDCHSNETKWPWYSYVAPISWRVADHVHEGRREFNMSEWEAGDGDESAEEVREDKMPLWDYSLAHPEAELTQTEKEEFLQGLIATFGEKE